MHLIDQGVLKNWPVLVSPRANKFKNIKKLVIFTASSFCYCTYNPLSYINSRFYGDNVWLLCWNHQLPLRLQFIPQREHFWLFFDCLFLRPCLKLHSGHWSLYRCVTWMKGCVCMYVCASMFMYWNVMYVCMHACMYKAGFTLV